MRYLLSLIHIPLAYFRLLFRRVYRLLKDLFFIPYLIRSYNDFNLKNYPVFSKILVRIGVWPFHLLSRIIDLTFFPELTDFIMLIFKPNSRSMTDTEIKEARKIFGDSLPYSMIRIDEKSLLAKLGARFNGNQHLGFVLFRTVNFTRKLDCKKGSNDLAWLIHELMHVWQAEYVGSNYIAEALHAQNTSGYGYGGTETLKQHWSLENFNREQQADIARNAYRSEETEKQYLYQPYIASIQKPSW